MIAMGASIANMRVNGDRLWDSLMTMARIGARPFSPSLATAARAKASLS